MVITNVPINSVQKALGFVVNLHSHVKQVCVLCENIDLQTEKNAIKYKQI